MATRMTRPLMTRRGAVRLTASATACAVATLLGDGMVFSRAVAAQERGATIALVPGEGGENYFYIPMVCGAQDAADELGVRLIVRGPSVWDAQEQAALLAEIVEGRPDAILIVPNDRAAMVAPIQEAIAAGIPVFTLDTAIDADTPLAVIASDNVEGGRIAARTLASEISQRGKVFVVNDIPGISSTDQREEGFAAEIATFPDIEYVGQDFCNGDADHAEAIARAKLQQVPDLVGIFGTNLPAAYGAAAAFERAGVKHQVKVVGFDAGPDQVDQLRAGDVAALIAQHPYDMGDVGVRMAVEYLETRRAPAARIVSTGYTVVTRENLEDADVARTLYGLTCPENLAAGPTS